jgi:hypothetical protein
MIYLRLAGGLGNQLFQISAASLISQKWGEPIGIITKSLSSYLTKRNPDSLCLISSDARARFVEVDESICLNVLINKCRIGRWFPWLSINDKNYWQNRHRQNPRFISVMDGYFQQGWTPDRLLTAIDSLKIYPYKFSGLIAKDEVVIHIRGGDFKQSALGFLGEGYYLKCIKLAVSAGWSKFVVVSDDIEFSQTVCEGIVNKVDGLKLRYVGGPRETLHDFNLLREASARIIGNSTFALWAALLGSGGSSTWSPSCLQKGLERDFRMNNEIIVNV